MKKEFVVNRQGKDFVLYAGLLDQAHREGLKRITTKLIQAPLEENGHMAICFAEVETEKGVFSGIGDANPQNVGRMIAMHTVRMSETRAKARALRDAINVGTTALEELADVEEDSSEPLLPQPIRTAPRPLQAVPQQPAASAEPAAPGAPPRAIGAVAAAVENPAGPATQQQLGRLQKLYAAVGRAPVIPEDMSYEQAASQITELVSVFNAQSRSKRRA